MTFASIKIWRDERFTTKSKYVRISVIWLLPIFALLAAVLAGGAVHKAERKRNKALYLANKNYSDYIKQETKEHADLRTVWDQYGKNIKCAQELTRSIFRKVREEEDVDKRIPALETVSDSHLKNTSILLQALDAIDSARNGYFHIPYIL